MALPNFLHIFGVAQNFWFNGGDFIAQKGEEFIILSFMLTFQNIVIYGHILVCKGVAVHNVVLKK